MPVRRFLSVTLLALALASVGAPAPAGAQEIKTLDEAAFSWPTAGRLTQEYGCTGFRTNGRRGGCAHFHNGIDIANARGTHILAAGPGTVRYVGWDPYTRSGPRAWVVIVSHANGLDTWYAHMLPRTVDGASVGDEVEGGQLIGYMGMTGIATGNHLHLMVERDGAFVDPGRYFEGRPPRRFLTKADLIPLVELTLGIDIT